MSTTPRNIKMLTLDSGKCPFETWYRSLRDVATRARIRARLTRLEDGNFGDWRSVGEGGRNSGSTLGRAIVSTTHCMATR